MNNFIIYSIEIAICLTLFYAAYWLFLKHETFFKLNRFYLLASVLLSLTLPLLNISITNAGNISKYLITPVEQYEQGLVANMEHELYGPFGPHYASRQKHAAVSQNKPNSPAVNNTAAASTNTPINWLNVLFFIYFTGALLVLLRFLANFIWIFAYILKHKPENVAGLKVVKYKRNISPFSFLNFIFLSRNDYPEAELEKILSHEKVHIEQKHSLDLIFLELLLAFQWYNPIVWLYKRAVKINHEYLADHGTLNAGIDLPSYQYSLLNQALGKNSLELASTYNFSIKNRIAMMLKKRSPKLAAFKLMIALPILFVVFTAFGLNNNTFINNEGIYAGCRDSIKKVDLPLDYLRSLEGEYHSTNEPHSRTITLTEVMGNLYGFDAGYSYKIIPVAEGKFVNPDDMATFIFDTKDKNDMGFVLFGKVQLKKVNYAVGSNEHPDRSMALTLTKILLKDGATAMTAYQKKCKDSTNYWSNDREINLVGYDLMEAKKIKEACIILKLATEMFAASYMCFDSYGEALLLNGDKTKAKEAFMESLRLNPGNKNAIKRLKELGVDPDSVVKIVKPTAEELQLLEGTYLSTDDHNWIRKIVFKVADGTLTGEDNGYKYKLIPMGNGKFINPDDGASLVFDTKDKDAISLLLFGSIHLKKAKISAAPELNIKEYAGVYVPSPKDTQLKNMEIISNNDKLFRYIKEEPDAANRTLDLIFITGNFFFYSDKSGRSIEFVVKDKKVTGCILRRWDGVFELTKQN